MSESACELIGSSHAMARLRQELAVAAKSSAKVVITGESGAGKELVARAVHRSSPRRLQPLRAVNLHVIGIRVPPLRERVDDIPVLLDHFMMRFSIQYQLPAPPIGTQTMAWLKDYNWPGNVRELRNLAERFVIRREVGGLDPAWLEATPTPSRFHRDAVCDTAPARRE